MKSNFDKKLIGSLSLGDVIHFAIAVITFAAISWIYFYPNDVNGDVLQQHDIMQGAANSQETTAFQEQTGEKSWWTDALFGGMPTFQIAPSYEGTTMLSPASALYRLYFPTPVSWIFLLMLGFFLLMLAFKVKWYYAVLGAIGYAFSSYFFILMGAGHIWKLMVLAYIPPTIAGIVWCYRGKYLGGAAVAAFFAALQLASNHVQMTYYSMFLIVALVIAYLVKAIIDKKVGRWCIATAALAVAAVLALAANSPNLYLTYKYAQETMRGGHSELTPKGEDAVNAKPTKGGLDKDYITQWSYGKGETFTLLIPNVKGGATIKPEHGGNRMLSLGETEKAEKMVNSGQMNQQDYQILSQFPQYFGDQPMTNGPVYVGALICALFLLGCLIVKGPVKWALLIATIISILLSWGHNMMWLTDWMIDHFPMYNKFRTVASILVIAEIAMPILAVLGLRELFKEPDGWRKHKVALLASFGLCAAICLLTAIAPGIFGHFSAEEHEQLVASGQIQQYPSVDAAIAAVRGALVSSDAWRSLIVILIGFAVIFGYLKGKLNDKLNEMVATLLVAGIVLVDMYAVNKRYIDSDSFTSHYDLPEQSFAPRPADTQILQDKDMNYRVMDVQHFGEAMPSYFHKTVGGYHAAKLTRYNDLINNQIGKNNMQVLNMLNTRYVIVDDQNVQRNPEALGNAWFVDSLTYVDNADQEMAFLDNFNAARSAVADAKFKQQLGQASAVQPGDTIYETSYAPNHLTYKSHSANGGLAVFSEIYFPWGWKVTVDGKPVEMGRVNYVLRALQLPAGDHEIDFKFAPDEVNKTQTWAKVAVVIIYLLLLLALNYALFGDKLFKKKEAEAPKA
ncbi:MAG: YfhO family protein [Muribaculaceae bacterium]|nr:YfhO family protein [Muribaculaceae bacterium]